MLWNKMNVIIKNLIENALIVSIIYFIIKYI